MARSKSSHAKRAGSKAKSTAATGTKPMAKVLKSLPAFGEKTIPDKKKEAGKRGARKRIKPASDDA